VDPTLEPVPQPVLVLSNPPHGDVDVAAAGPVVGLAPADLRLKVNYAVPEIWLAEDEQAAADAAATRLRAAGFRVVVVPGAALAEIPERRPVPVFTFESDALVLEAAESVRLAYGAPLLAVQCSVRPGEAKAALPPSFLDLYAVVESALGRWTVVQGATEFGGLAGRATASFGTNVQTLTSEIERRFSRATVDRRLVNMQVRRRVGAPPPGVVRRGFSYATAPLHELLDRLKPGLSEMEHQELASRLVFLTHAAG